MSARWSRWLVRARQDLLIAAPGIAPPSYAWLRSYVIEVRVTRLGARGAGWHASVELIVTDGQTHQLVLNAAGSATSSGTGPSTDVDVVQAATRGAWRTVPSRILP